jgi:8-oxo-dGTP pyrophosphatase MutT (NUDIX family)
MTSVDRLWFLADEARQQSEQTYHRLRDRHGEFMEVDRFRRVTRDRFRTLARRVKDTGAPFGTHSIVRRESEDVLLVRHEGVDLWVLPGGEVDATEAFREAAERELHEEAGVSATYDGVTLVTRVEVTDGDHTLWGVVPVFFARAETTDLSVNDPDGEISDARWFSFDDLPEDTRDRSVLLTWRERTLG